MHVQHFRVPFVFLSLVLYAGAAAAQSIPGWETKQFAMERLDAERVRLMREVEVTGVGANAGQQIFADDLLWNIRTGELTAEGNVLLVSPTGRIAAERAVFNTKNGRGTFYTASGTASLGARGAQDRSMFGTLEPDVMFYGRMIEKIGDDRYRITNGAFTSCAQPTPRWEIVSSKATIDLEDYAILRNAVIRVKNVPVLYLPILYYPIQSDDRATGFLMPSYGNSSYRGHSISNAFFWAINRSQDLTLFHDWMFTKGQGYGSEYRYTMGAGAEGQIRVYRLAENAGTLETAGGSVAQDARRSLELRGNLTQPLPGGFRAYSRLDYFSNVGIKQLYQQDFNIASNSTRTLSIGASGALKTLSLSATATRSESFYNQTTSYVNGAMPSISASLSSRQFGTLPLFGSVQSEISNTLYQIKAGDNITDSGLWRMEVWPSLRAPVVKLPFLTVNGSLSWRYTHFTERLVDRVQVPIGLDRKYFDMGVDVAGPVFNRVFAPKRESARRIKHVFEPFVGIHRITAIPERDAIPITGGNDYVFGGNGTINYGFNNRIIMRSPPPEGA
jgi:LPS-assembly protein